MPNATAKFSHNVLFKTTIFPMVLVYNKPR